MRSSFVVESREFQMILGLPCSWTGNPPLGSCPLTLLTPLRVKTPAVNALYSAGTRYVLIEYPSPFSLASLPFVMPRSSWLDPSPTITVVEEGKNKCWVRSSNPQPTVVK